MFYFGERPWHKLGIELKEAPTSKDAIIASGLNWKVSKEKVIVNDVESDEFFAIKRSDKNTPKSILGIVGKKYSPVQNENAFDFFDTIVGEKKAMYHTAGSLNDGKTIWILAKLPDGLSISSNDKVELYTLLSNRHDGKRSLIVQPTPIRVVCNNTLNMALRDSSNRMNFRHTSNVEQKMKMAALSLNFSLKTFAETKDAYKLIAKKEVTTDSLNEYFDNVINFDKARQTKQSLTKKNRLLDIFNYDLTESKSKPSLWIAYNAITYYTDHEMGRERNRLSNAWVGNGFLLKQKALDIAVSMAS
jgi:phage/plasmid-like protein (TIGR03299 family)